MSLAIRASAVFVSVDFRSVVCSGRIMERDGVVSVLITAVIVFSALIMSTKASALGSSRSERFPMSLLLTLLS